VILPSLASNRRAPSCPVKQQDEESLVWRRGGR
jgi:hypothetical protein